MKTRATDRTERLHEIERMLFETPTGLRVVEIAHACGVDRRTIYRDLAVLMEGGLPVQQRDGRFFIDLENYLVNLRLSVHEAGALVMAIALFRQQAEQSNPYLAMAARKLGQVLPELLSDHANLIAETLQSQPAERHYSAVLETLMRAWAERRLVELWYGTNGEDEFVSREFAVYFLDVAPKGTVIAVGYDSMAKGVRALRLRRITRIRLLTLSFEIPVQFNPRRYLATMGEAASDIEVAP
ncbi:MAG: WYL domain-containing protein [bacterium]|nr:WYL domain-containing protein [bacterium]